MKNAKIKQVLINILFIVLAFTVQNCVFPLLPFLSVTPNLLLILTFSFGFIHGKMQACSTVFCQGFCWICFTAAPSDSIPYICVHRLYERHLYKILL